MSSTSSSHHHRNRRRCPHITIIAFIIFPTKHSCFNNESLRGHAITKSLQETITEIKTKIEAEGSNGTLIDKFCDAECQNEMIDAMLRSVLFELGEAQKQVKAEEDKAAELAEKIKKVQ